MPNEIYNYLQALNNTHERRQELVREISTNISNSENYIKIPITDIKKCYIH
jgi:hypothetical protein